MIVLKEGNLQKIGWLFHAFFTRSGGCSRGPFSSLNLSFTVGDSPEDVFRNWEKVKDYLPFREIHLLRQIHSDRVLESNEFYGKSPIWIDEGDGLITSTPGLGVGVLTADCVPVVLVNLDKKRVAVVHSGWRGTVRNIAGRAVEKLGNPHSEKIMAVIGPAISGERYSVGKDVVEEFQRAGLMRKDFYWKDTSGVYHLDLQNVVKFQLISSGLSPDLINVIPCCTYGEELLFSYRKEKECGRMLTVAGII